MHRRTAICVYLFVMFLTSVDSKRKCDANEVYFCQTIHCHHDICLLHKSQYVGLYTHKSIVDEFIKVTYDRNRESAMWREARPQSLYVTLNPKF